MMRNIISKQYIMKHRKIVSKITIRSIYFLFFKHHKTYSILYHIYGQRKHYPFAMDHKKCIMKDLKKIALDLNVNTLR